VRSHDLRHFCASLLLLQGVPARVVMEILGHSQIVLTMNTYSHVMPALTRQAADQMNAVFAPRRHPTTAIEDASDGRGASRAIRRAYRWSRGWTHPERVGAFGSRGGRRRAARVAQGRSAGLLSGLLSTRC
jgi:hypothetical protein